MQMYVKNEKSTYNSTTFLCVIVDISEFRIMGLHCLVATIRNCSANLNTNHCKQQRDHQY